MRHRAQNDRRPRDAAQREAGLNRREAELAQRVADLLGRKQATNQIPGGYGNQRPYNNAFGK